MKGLPRRSAAGKSKHYLVLVKGFAVRVALIDHPHRQCMHAMCFRTDINVDMVPVGAFRTLHIAIMGGHPYAPRLPIRINSGARTVKRCFDRDVQTFSAVATFQIPRTENGVRHFVITSGCLFRRRLPHARACAVEIAGCGDNYGVFAVTEMRAHVPGIACGPGYAPSEGTRRAISCLYMAACDRMSAAPGGNDKHFSK